MDGYPMTQSQKKIAVMALSGGMDSTSLLLHLLSKGYEVTAISFNYGQKHVLELERASSLIRYLEKHNIVVRHHVADLTSATALFESHLLKSGDEIPRGHYEEDTMKATVVPNRNALFSSLLYGTALSIANTRDSHVEVVLGVHSGDHAIYPDCRPEFYNALEHAFALGNWDSDRVSFTLPYLHSDKIGILKDAEVAIKDLSLNFDDIFRRTLTSYQPDADGRSDGSTGSDVERILAFNAIGRQDPVEYVKPWDEVLADALEIERAHKDEEYKERLTELQYYVTRQAGTERAFTGQYWDEKRAGEYRCICCSTLLFTSTMKFDSGCGWPSFHTEHQEANIMRVEDHSHGMHRVEVRCSACDAHLGHVFNDGPAAYGGERYCINSASMTFEEQDGEQG
ncbi:MAG: peptide-methionine (R)-S-oxide reductase MsrB [Poseidonia sp.]